MSEPDVFVQAESQKRFVPVSDLAQWIDTLIAGIQAECEGAPVGCNEIRAYLYGEICCLRILRRRIETWLPEEDEKSAENAGETR